MNDWSTVCCVVKLPKTWKDIAATRTGIARFRGTYRHFHSTLLGKGAVTARQLLFCLAGSSADRCLSCGVFSLTSDDHMSTCRPYLPFLCHVLQTLPLKRSDSCRNERSRKRQKEKEKINCHQDWNPGQNDRMTSGSDLTDCIAAIRAQLDETLLGRVYLSIWETTRLSDIKVKAYPFAFETWPHFPLSSFRHRKKRTSSIATFSM